jgi:hypothetical protein
VPPHRGPSPTAAVDVVGHRLWGRRQTSVQVADRGTATLLLFLSAHCDGCRPLWGLVRDPAANGVADVRVVAVVDPKGWRERLILWRTAGSGARRSVVRSPESFAAYRVHAPFFVLIDGEGPTVATEGVAFGVEDVVAYVTSALPRKSSSEA